jgi:hypothetical protein
MPFADFLVDRCTIERLTDAAATYGDGSPQETWADHAVLVPCRYVTSNERVASPSGFVSAVTTKLLVGSGLDVTSADRIKSITLSGRGTLGVHTIEAVIPRIGARSNHHIELQIEKVT